MKIAVTSQGPDLDADVDPRFGRCSYVLIVETDGMHVMDVANPYIDDSGGAGSRLASLVADQHVDALLTGAAGPNAQDALEAAGIETVTNVRGTIREAVDAYLGRELDSPDALDARRPTSQDSPRHERYGGHGEGRGYGEGRQRRRRQRQRSRWRRFEQQSGSD